MDYNLIDFDIPHSKYLEMVFHNENVNKSTKEVDDILGLKYISTNSEEVQKNIACVFEF